MRRFPAQRELNRSCCAFRSQFHFPPKSLPATTLARQRGSPERVGDCGCGGGESRHTAGRILHWDNLRRHRAFSSNHDEVLTGNRANPLAGVAPSRSQPYPSVACGRLLWEQPVPPQLPFRTACRVVLRCFGPTRSCREMTAADWRIRLTRLALSRRRSAQPDGPARPISSLAERAHGGCLNLRCRRWRAASVCKNKRSTTCPRSFSDRRLSYACLRSHSLSTVKVLRRRQPLRATRRCK